MVIILIYLLQKKSSRLKISTESNSDSCQPFYYRRTQTFLRNEMNALMRGDPLKNCGILYLDSNVHSLLQSKG